MTQESHDRIHLTFTSDLEAAEEASGHRSQSSLMSTSSDHMSMYPEMPQMAMSVQAPSNTTQDMLCGTGIMRSGSKASASQRERISQLVANRKREGKSSGLKIRGQNLDEDATQRFTKRQKTRQWTLDVESDEVLRREDETVIVLVPEESSNTDIRYRLISMRPCLQSQVMQPTSQTTSSHNGQISL